MNGRPGRVDGRLVEVNGRPGEVEGRFIEMNGRPRAIDGRPSGPSGRFIEVDGRPGELAGLLAPLPLDVLASMITAGGAPRGRRVLARRITLSPIKTTNPDFAVALFHVSMGDCRIC